MGQMILNWRQIFGIGLRPSEPVTHPEPVRQVCCAWCGAAAPTDEDHWSNLQGIHIAEHWYFCDLCIGESRRERAASVLGVDITLITEELAARLTIPQYVTYAEPSTMEPQSDRWTHLTLWRQEMLKDFHGWADTPHPHPERWPCSWCGVTLSRNWGHDRTSHGAGRTLCGGCNEVQNAYFAARGLLGSPRDFAAADSIGLRPSRKGLTLSVPAFALAHETPEYRQVPAEQAFTAVRWAHVSRDICEELARYGRSFDPYKTEQAMTHVYQHAG